MVNLLEQAVFFDRDGTLIKDKHYLDDPSEVEWIDGAKTTLRTVQNRGFKIIIVTNQSGVARGMMTEEDVQAIHDRIRRDLTNDGITVDDFYYCPYLAEAEVEEYRKDSRLRKPAPGMLQDAEQDHNLDLSRCVMVGDKSSDVEAGQRAGCRTVLVRTGKSSELDSVHDFDVNPDHVVDSVEHVPSVIGDTRRETGV
jgi:D-glycero-D-manno-heptose 1,7-bisphosphate phosphatase